MNNFSRLLNKRSFILVFLVICFLSLRLLIVLTDVKQIEFNEETACGLLANDLINDYLRLPILDYQHVQWCGDTLVVGFLAIPFFLIFGNSLISLKLIPLFFSLGTLIIWYLFLNKYFNRTIAVLMSLLFILSPPYYTRMNLIAAIPHTEVNFLAIAVVFLLFKSLNNSRWSVSLILCGILSGLGIYFHYLFLITLSTCFLLWYVQDKGFIFKRRFLTFLLSFLIGLAPWIISNIHNFPLGLPIVRGYFNPILQLKKLFRLVAYNIPHSFGFDYTFETGNILSLSYYLIFIALFFSLVIQQRKLILGFLGAALPAGKFSFQSKESMATLFILIFPVVYAFFFTLSNFYDVPPFVIALGNIFDLTSPSLKVARYRYLLPLYPFVFAIISLGLYYFGLKAKRSFNRFLACSIIGYLLLLGLYGNVTLITWDKFGKGFVYKGYGQWYFAEDIVRQNRNFEKKVASLNDLEGAAKFKGFRILGRKMFHNHRHTLVSAIKKIETVLPAYRYYLYSGLISRLSETYETDQERVMNFINDVPEGSRSFCYEEYGISLAYRLLKRRWDAYACIRSLSKIEKLLYNELLKEWEEPKWDLAQYIKSVDETEELYRPFCYIGLGKFLARERASVSIDKSLNTINKVDKRYKRYCYLGFGQEIGEVFNNVNMNLLTINQIPGPFQKFFFEEIDHNLDKFLYYTNKIEERYRSYIYEGLGLAVKKNIDEKYVINYLIKKITAKYKNEFRNGLIDAGKFSDDIH